MSDPATKRLGDYEILQELGRGGMGRVYKVRNTITDRVEAMKVLLPDLQGHEDVAARFQREIKVLAALNHPNIAALHTALTIDNQLVMVMEYVEGQSLSSRLDSGPIAVPDALHYMDQVLDALSFAHRQKVIHRDIKPANMMLTPENNVKLMDFGIARTSNESNKLTATGSTLGSMNYMSPEQVKGEPTDERSDLYSLGISLYEMVTGQKPFDADSNFSIMAAQINQAPTPPADLQPGLPRQVNDIILTAIAKAPAQRFQSADAFRHVVQRFLKSLQNANTLVQGSHEHIPIGGDATLSYAHTASDATTTSHVPPPRPLAAPVPAAQPAVPYQMTAPAVAAPAAAPNMPPPAASPASHRGLYMALGVLVMIAVLVAAGLYMPGRKKASAAEDLDSAKHAQETTTTSPQQTQTVVTPPEPKPIDAQQKKLAAKKSGSTPDAGGADKAALAAELDAVEHDIDQLTSRAAAVNSSLDNLQRQQAAEGYGLRGDIVSRQASMKLNLSKAQTAIEHNDAERAKRYAALTDADVEALEKFLGR